jgi:Protein of unknown function (DUF1329)
MKTRIGIIGLAMSSVFAGSALAAVSAEEAKQLGTTLTAIGAEKAGNKEGTIPAYTGEGVKPPANYDPKKPQDRPNPYANEKPLFSITAQNAAQYADKLDGTMELFKKFPDFRMDIYPTHRSSTVPKWVADNTIKNATACKGTGNDLKLEGCYGGYVFPIPKNGTQVMWNHLTAYEAESWQGFSRAYIVANTGKVTQVSGDDYVQQSDFYDPAKTTPSTSETIYWKVRVDSVEPPRKAGEKLVLIDPLDILGVGRRAWQYIPGQRRVKLAPDLAYDTPAPTGGGVITMDDAKVFLGSLDRYDWKMLPKKEKFIMANSFMMTDKGRCSDKVVLTKSFMNPDCVRWELHRVWVVEAKIKPGFRHIYPHRFFYWDEDNYAGGGSEQFDAAGKMYRQSYAVAFPFWTTEGAGTAGDGTVTYDLNTGNYFQQGTDASPGQGKWIIQAKKPLYFSPEALAGEGIR